jgi:hypothetical protein
MQKGRSPLFFGRRTAEDHRAFGLFDNPTSLHVLEHLAFTGLFC